nr:MAG TPA: Protein of unknown function (DUF1642) [Caudoviricetes sp.]
MNKQELIKEFEEIGIYKLNIFSTEIKTIPTETAIELIKQLDEPEPLPFKLKDVVRRIRGFDPTTQTRWLNDILKELGDDYGSMKYRSGYEQGKLEGEWVGNQLKDADKIRQELNKPVIPQFVAVWIEECKAKGKNLLRALLYTPEKVNSWVDDPDNQEIFALAWMFGYTVENEKRYTVVIKETKQPLYYNAVDKKLFFSMGGLATNFTQQQLEKLNFGWIFFCPGIEIKEVE